jgi:hypothetical protein
MHLCLTFLHLSFLTLFLFIRLASSVDSPYDRHCNSDLLDLKSLPVPRFTLAFLASVALSSSRRYIFLMSDFLGPKKKKESCVLCKKVKINYCTMCSRCQCTHAQRFLLVSNLKAELHNIQIQLFFFTIRCYLPKTKGAKDNFGCHFVSDNRRY